MEKEKIMVHVINRIDRPPKEIVDRFKAMGVK